MPDDRRLIWEDIEYLAAALDAELRALAGGDVPPWERLSPRALGGIQDRLTGTIHRLRELREKG